jgi:hypothetical protein
LRFFSKACFLKQYTAHHYDFFQHVVLESKPSFWAILSQKTSIWNIHFAIIKHTGY